MSGEERWRRAGVSGSLRGRKLEEMTQSNTSLRESEVPLESQRGNWSPPEWRDFWRREEWRKVVGSAIRWRGANSGGIHINKRKRRGVVKRDVDPYIIRVGIERIEEVESSEKDRPCLTTPQLACVASEERMPDREWVRSKRKAENPGIRKEEDELRLDSGIQGRPGETRESEVVQCSLLEDLQHSIGEPWESQGGEEAGNAEGRPGSRDGGEGAEGEGIKWARGNKRFGDEGGARVLN